MKKEMLPGDGWYVVHRVDGEDLHIAEKILMWEIYCPTTEDYRDFSSTNESDQMVSSAVYVPINSLAIVERQVEWDGFMYCPDSSETCFSVKLEGNEWKPTSAGSSSESIPEHERRFADEQP